MAVRELQKSCEWGQDDVADPAVWTEQLAASELLEIDFAVARARSLSLNLIDIGRDDFPLSSLSLRLKAIERRLIVGRGFVLIRGLSPTRYDRDEMCLGFWGIGAHLGHPWPQNSQGHLFADVTDQGKHSKDPRARGTELGGIKFELHCDRSDVVGLLCLQSAVSGGLSIVCNSVALHNEMVRTRPDLAAALYLPIPFDMRGEQEPGDRPWIEMPVFTEVNGRLFIRFILAYIIAAQRHADAPRLSALTCEALSWFRVRAESGKYSVMMRFEPGDMQFINNYHVIHGRTSYIDDPSTGRVRHLKRLWLECDALSDRPAYFRTAVPAAWGVRRSAGHLGT
jgi:hypothetical protein